MSNLREHEFRLVISVYPYSSSEIASKGYRGSVHFRTEITAPSIQVVVATLIAIYGACKWFDIGGYFCVKGVRQYVCLYTSETGFSSWYHDLVNGQISA